MKLGLGTVQFGMNYGVANQNGQPQWNEVEQILAVAEKCQIHVLDTAPVYGQSEIILGEVLKGKKNFNIVTKIPRFAKTAIKLYDVAMLHQSFEQSLATLHCPSVYGLLLHDADDALCPGGNLLFDAMKSLKNNGKVQKIGFSVYSTAQIDALMSRYTFDLIQVPVNLFDQRLINNGALVRLKKAGVEIHARSVFLQGLVLMPLNTIPDYFKPIMPKFEAFHQLLEKKQLSPLEAALGFVLGLKELDVILCGTDSASQLEQICQQVKALDTELFTKFNLDDERYSNPAMWQL